MSGRGRRGLGYAAALLLGAAILGVLAWSPAERSEVEALSPGTDASREADSASVRHAAAPVEAEAATIVASDAPVTFAGTGSIVTLDLSAGTIAESGRDSVRVDGTRDVRLDVAGAKVRVVGTRDDDALTFAARGAGVGLLSMKGHDTRYHFTNLPVDAPDGVSPVTVNAGAGDDVLTVSLNGTRESAGWLTYDGGDDDDTLVVTGRPGTPVENLTYNPGPGDKDGRLIYACADASPLLGIQFHNLEPVIDLVVAGTLVVNATNASNAITYRRGVNDVSYGLVSVDGFETIEFANKWTLILNASDGDDHVVLNNPIAPAQLQNIVVNGGNGTDTLDSTGENNRTVTLNGDGGNDVLIGGALPNDLDGGEGDDEIVLGAFTGDAIGGSGSDVVVVQGTMLDDTIHVFQPDLLPRRIDVTVNGDNGFVRLTDCEGVRVDAGDGDDAITVGNDDTFDPAHVIPIRVMGGAPDASDALIVEDQGLGDVILQRLGADGQSGSVAIWPNGGPTSLIVYEGIEAVDVMPIVPNTGQTGTDAEGHWVVFPFDDLEPNDTIPNATTFNVGGEFTRNLAIDDAYDNDYFRLIPSQTGMMTIDILFAEVDTLGNGRPGLPVDGDVELFLVDDTGEVVASSLSYTDNESITIPVVAGEEYYARVKGDLNAINAYTLSVRNVAAPVPTSVTLDSATDTGYDAADGVTQILVPRVLVQADLSAFDAAGVAILTAAEAEAGTLPGVAVFVTVTNTVTGVSWGGYADAVGTSRTLFDYIPTSPLTDGTYLVSASIRVFDASLDAGGTVIEPVVDSTTLSAPFQLLVDSTAPVGGPADLLTSSDTGVLDDDDVTNMTMPAFQGTGEPNAMVRIYADGSQVGSGVVGTLGTWEVTVEPLSDGQYAVVADYEDLAGNISAPSAPLIVEIDTEAPNTPYLDLVTADDTGASDIDNVTDVATPQLTSVIADADGPDGHLFPDNINYRVYDRFSAEPETLVAGDGPLGANGAFTDVVDLRLLPEVIGDENDGVHNLKLEAEDRAGNISPDFILQIVLDQGGSPFDGKSKLEYGPVPVGPFVSATDGMYKGRVRVTWSAVDTAQAYRVFRGTREDFTDAEFIGEVTADLFFDDYSADVRKLNGCTPSLEAVTYFYQVFAEDGSKAATLVGSDTGYVRTTEPAAEYVLPSDTTLTGYQLIDENGVLSARICGLCASFTPADVWAIVYADTTLDAANVSVDVNPAAFGSDLWITYTPSVLWQPDEIIYMTVGATDASGCTFGPVTYAFMVVTAKSAAYGDPVGQPGDVLLAAIPQEDIPSLAGGTGEAYVILPEEPFTDARTVWLPVPDGADALQVYYLLRGPEEAEWVAGEAMKNWMVGVPEYVQSGGVGYMAVRVTHGGVVQLGPVNAPSVASASVVPVTAPQMADVLLAGALLIGLLVAARRFRNA
ncbi:MAG: hypothetical protein GY851_01085 [bacterium]|nr:hypothetical protein [bacterium]